MAIVTIVGAGLMGTATAWPLIDNGHQVRLVGTHLDRGIIQSCLDYGHHPRLKRDLPEGVRPYFLEDIAEALAGAEIIVSGVNSSGAHWIGRTLTPHLKPDQLLIAVTKGLEVDEAGEILMLPEVLRRELPTGIQRKVKLAAIGGPCIAGELAGRRQSCVVFGCADRFALERLAGTFRTSYYHIWTTTDLFSLEVSAALKNAYTLGVGLVAGMLERSSGLDHAGAHMHNLAAAVFAQGCTEIEYILEMIGGTTSFAYGLPGAGDLYVTAAGGRTVRMGKLLGEGLSFATARQVMANETLESIEIIQQMAKALAAFTERALLSPQDLPLLQHLVDIVVQGKPADIPLDKFFMRNTSLQHASRSF